MGRGIWWSGIGLLLFLTACGGSDSDGQAAQQAASTPPTTATAAAAAAPTATVAGDPPASPETERIDAILAGATLPTKVAVFGRRDIPNDAVEQEAPDAARRFREFGRVTGAFYILSVDGAQRMTLSINQYGSPDGAAQEFAFGQGNPRPEDRLEADGIGEDRSAFRSTSGAGAGQISQYLISFTRGCHYVVVVDFLPSGTNTPPDSALALARAVDDRLKDSSPDAAGCG
ncbi:MAG: hypothetical protein AB7R89_18385 [Dehalococcoidia bacterium]